MSPERHRRVKELFLAACDLGAGERESLLARECDDDRELRREVEHMLGVDASGVPALDRQAMASTRSRESPAGPERREQLAGEVERLAVRASSRCYQLEDELGRGGMARVVRARDVDLRRDLAMKISLGARAPAPATPGSSGATLDAARFLEEARTTARLDHPGVVPVHDLGVDAEGRLFFTMKLVQGRDLGRILRLSRQGDEGWSTPRVVGVLQKVCEAVAYAHSKGVVHRDLKPANVMVGEYGEVYVMDWGISRVLGDGRADASAPAESARDEGAALTRAGSILGTPYGMPPEQARGEPVGPPADVYAVGAMLYQTLAGRRPYESDGGADTATQVLERIRLGPPEPLARLAPAASPELVAIAERAMARSPGERYPDMRELGQDLRAYLEGRIVRAYRTGAIAELRKWISRNRLASSGIALALAAVLGGLLWSREVERRSRGEIDLASDYFRARVLRDTADELWPAAPATVPALADWIARAELLAARRDLHAQRLARLESAPSPDATEIGRQRALSGYLDELQGTGGAPGLLQAVRARLAFASTIEERSVAGADVAERWRAARASILAGDTCEAYAGLDLAPQLGLAPLGPDPASGLHEFAHLETGEPAARDAERRLEITAATGIVFVLVPGGTFSFGASAQEGGPNHDAKADPNEEPVNEVTLAPFFLSKYEMTQAQWERVTGGNPSRWPAGERGITPTNPVEQVSWNDSDRILGRMGLRLPTEARWEYACRAGTDTPFWGGSERLERFANVGDRAYREQFAATYPVEEIDDGFAYHAPAGRLEPNAFGLHDVHGNVFEWTRDVYSSHGHPRAPGDGETTFGTDRAADAWGSADYRVIRGGSFELPAHYSRASHRVNFAPSSISHAIGVRPAREIEAAAAR